MEVLVREYTSRDAKAVIAVYRDAIGSLRKSRGGSHPDQYVDRLDLATDEEVLRTILYSKELAVAEINGQIVGIGGITNRLKNRILGSTYSCNHYVKREFQGGGVGSLIKKWTIERARRIGFRKIYGYSTPEGMNFNRKYGAAFFPQFDRFREGSGVKVHYYEIELRNSFLNRFRIEPYVSEMSALSKLLKKR